MNANNLNILIASSFILFVIVVVIYYIVYISYLRRKRLVNKISKKILLPNKFIEGSCLYGSSRLDVVSDHIGLYKQEGYSSVVYFMVLSYPYKSEKIFYNDYGIKNKEWDCVTSKTINFEYKNIFDKSWYFIECDGEFIRFYYHLPIFLSSMVIDRTYKIHCENLEKIKLVSKMRI
ncbi:MAG: hypothetical protein ACI8SR_000445 [Oceanicoccus sp.]|jgi:hypothetical protein